MTYGEAIVSEARKLVGIREDPPKSNHGPVIDALLRDVGLDPERGSYPWCAATAYGVYKRGAESLKIRNPLPRRAVAMKMLCDLEESGLFVVNYPGGYNADLVPPGGVFFLDHEGPSSGKPRWARKGHCGIVIGRGAEDGTIVTVEGNTDPSGGRDGDGCYERTRRLDEINAAIAWPWSVYP